MANKKIFKPKSSTPATTTYNAAGGVAYDVSPKQAIAQIACTNCFNGTYYVSAEDNLAIARDAALNLKGDPAFLAKTAIYSRTKAYMRDMPAFLMAILAQVDTKLFRQVFPLVIDNGKMLRNFAQIARSGATGKALNLSAGAVRKAINAWFAAQPSWKIFNASVGQEFPLDQLLRASHVRPSNPEKAALLAYLCGAKLNKENNCLESPGPDHTLRTHPFGDLPQVVRDYETFKNTHEGTVPRVDFRMLDSLGLTEADWTEIARTAPWTMTRMNLNTFARHGVLKNKEVVDLIAARLRNREEIAKAKAFPYQLLMSFKATENNADVPHEIREALQDAMEIAIENVPEFDGQVYVCVDTSGSMQSPVTGDRYGASTAVSCVDVAGLFAASILRRNRSAQVIPFDTSVHLVQLNGRDTVLTNAQKLALQGGGTNCSCALAHLNQQQAKGSAVIYVSDYESWVDRYYDQGTGLLNEWQKFSRRNHNAKLVCIDLTPRDNSQVKEHENILSIAGFGDACFSVIDGFIRHGHEKNYWVAEIEKINLDGTDAGRTETPEKNEE